MSSDQIRTDPLPLARLAIVGLLLSLPLVAVTTLSTRSAILVLAGLAAIAGLAILGIADGRSVLPVLFITCLALVSVPIDKYLFYQEHVGGWPGIRIAAADLVLVALVPIAMIGRLRGTTRNRIPTSVIALYGLLIAVYLISSFGAPHRDLAFFEVASAVHALLLAVVCAALFRREYVVPILLILMVLVVLHTSFATLQVATGRPIGVGLGASPADVIKETFSTGDSRIRPAGLFDHPIVFANFLMLALPLLAAGAMIVRSRLLRLAFFGAVVVAVLGLGLTLSRGAWISTTVTGVVFLWMAWRRRLLSRRIVVGTIVAGVVVAVVAGGVLGPRIIERVAASQAGNLDVRFELNKIALRMIEAHPITGVGLNNFIPTMEAYDPDDVMKYFPATVHNLYLLEAAEAGLPALLVGLALISAIFVTTRARLRRTVDPVLIWFAIAIFAGLCGFAVSQVADFSHRLEPLRSVLWVHIGLLFGALGGTSTMTETDPKRSDHES